MECCLLWPLSAWVNKDTNTYFTELWEPDSETDNTSFQAARGAGRKFLEQETGPMTALENSRTCFAAKAETCCTHKVDAE